MPREKKAKVWERQADEWYVEPKCVSDALFSVERFTGQIWDPACGGGNILESARRHFYSALGSDIRRRSGVASIWFMKTHDFLSDDMPPIGDPVFNIVCNPPYGRAKLAEAFIRKATEIAIGKVAMFLDIRFLGGETRANGLWRDCPPDRIWMLSPRPSCPPGEYLEGGGKAEGGTADFCWCIWDQTTPYRGTSFDWLAWSEKDARGVSKSGADNGGSGGALLEESPEDDE